MENSNKFLTFLAFLFLYSCINQNAVLNKGVECRLYWVGDSYPLNTQNADMSDYRMISLHYIIINNSLENYYLPIKNKGLTEDSICCSKMIAFIDKKPIETWFSTDVGWNGILKHSDSIHAKLIIPERILESANVNRLIILTEFLDRFELKYDRCLSDSIYSTFSIPLLKFTMNDSIALHYKDHDKIIRINERHVDYN